MRQRKCKVCGDKYEPFNSLQQACSPRCAIELGKVLQKKARRKELREAKQKLKSKADWAKEAQSAFNAWIRERDRGKPCISCGTTTPGTHLKGNSGFVASHYCSIGAKPELRYHPDNVHAACVKCNSWLSGNIVEYRRGLIERIGLERVEALEGPHEPKRYRIEELKEIRDTYRLKLKEEQRRVTREE